jgi:hypothetical protein
VKAAIFLIALLMSGALASAQLETTFFEGIDHPAIEYHTRIAHDPVAELNRRLSSGGLQLAFDPVRGYLPATLEALKISIDSQIAVFSKTSVQAAIISPRNPRTLFFNDAVAVGWMRGGFIELAAQDPQQGVIFYLLPQLQTTTPQFIRNDGCLSCHYSYNTLGVPGMLARSVVADPRGVAMPYLGNYLTDHRSPFDERWAGWYVTGSVGSMRHLGNAMVADRDRFDEAITADTLNLKSLDGKFDTAPYLSPHSDVVALMVFDHQMAMINLLTRIGWEARIGAPLRGKVKELVDYLLFVDEPKLPGHIQGSSQFAETFAKAGPRDSKGRSLRELDLDHRLLRYPCSYMIYSAAFDALPADARSEIYQRMSDILSGRDTDPRYARLSSSDRQAVIEILTQTKPGFASSVIRQ